MITRATLAVLAATAVTAATANTAFAQTVFSGTDIAETRNETLMSDIEADAERETAAFGNENRDTGFTGSVAMRGISTFGNSDSVDIGIGANLGYVNGPNGYSLALNYAYGSDAGTKTEDSLFYGAEYTRDFNSNFFGYGKVQGTVDAFSGYKSDTFASVGAGYRIIQTPDTQWSVQAGPGYRFADLRALASVDVSEAGFGVSSDFSKDLSSSIALTNDTDLIWSKSDTVAYNDMAISVAMSDALALRTSLLTEYHSQPTAGAKNMDNTVGVSLVYSFK
jgi:putative salt-induced outer membrane protein